MVTLVYHDGLISNPQAFWHGNKSADGIKHGERIGVYVQNNSAQKVIFSEIRLGDTSYTFQDMGPNNQMTPYSMDATLNNKEYTIATNGNHNTPADTIVGGMPELKPGQKVTIILELEQNINKDRDMHFQIITEKGGIFVYTIISGQQIG